MKKLLTVFIIVTLAFVVSPSAFSAESTNPYGATSVDPAGPTEVIFSVSKKGKKISFTSKRLNNLKTSVISVYEPFLKKRQSFTVIPMKTFFTLAGISGRDKVQTKALNDYIFSESASNFLAANGYIAIRRNGVDIPYDQGGPVRIIFADNSKWSNNLDAWNWSLISLSVK
jgi:hypothetical protein